MERSRDEEDGEDDIVEVDLAEVPGLEGNWEMRAVGQEEFLIRAVIGRKTG